MTKGDYAYSYNIGYAIIAVIFIGLLIAVFYTEKIPGYSDTEGHGANAGFDSSNDISD